MHTSPDAMTACNQSFRRFGVSLRAFNAEADSKQGRKPEKFISGQPYSQKGSKPKMLPLQSDQSQQVSKIC